MRKNVFIAHGFICTSTSHNSGVFLGSNWPNWLKCAHSTSREANLEGGNKIFLPFLLRSRGREKKILSRERETGWGEARERFSPSWGGGEALGGKFNYRIIFLNYFHTFFIFGRIITAAERNWRRSPWGGQQGSNIHEARNRLRAGQTEP